MTEIKRGCRKLLEKELLDLFYFPSVIKRRLHQ